MQDLSFGVRYLSSTLASFSRNRFKIAPSGASSNLNPGDQMSFTLPAQSILDLSTVRIHMEITPSGGTTAILPPTTDLIQSQEIYINGTQVSTIQQEFNTCQSAYSICNESVDRGLSFGNALQCKYSLSSNANKKQSVVWSASVGMLGGEVSSRLLPTALCGDVLLRFVLAPSAVMMASSTYNSPTFKVNSVYLTVDTISMGENVLESLLFARLNESPDASIPLVFYDYDTFSHRNASSGFTHQFSISSGSVNNCLSVLRNQAYSTGGLPLGVGTGVEDGTQDDDAVGSTGFDAERSRYMFFQAYNTDNTNGYGDWSNKGLTNGTMSFYHRSANIQYPQYQATSAEAIADTFLINNRVSDHDRGNSLQSMAAWNYGKCVIPCIFNSPSSDYSIRSGLDTRGSSTQFELTVNGIDTRNKSSNEPGVTGITCTTFVQTSKVLHLQANRSCYVER